MKKYIAVFVLVMLTVPAWAGGRNPFFGRHQNQIALNVGQGIDCGFLIPPPARFVPFSFMHIQYSQPTTFFKLPARQSLNVGQTIGYGKKYDWDWEKYTIPMVFASQDAVLLYGDKWYYSTGVGIGFQAQQNERIGSKLLFQFKIAVGYNISDRVNGEVFVQHFSNGNTAPENNSYAFYGAGLVYNF